MSFFNLFKTPDINQGIEKYKQEAEAVLLDVRTEEEYEQGHIENSINVPLHMIKNAKKYIKTDAVPIYVYCLSGARSSQAVAALKKMGYTNVINIGGINRYRGKIVR